MAKLRIMLRRIVALEARLDSHAERLDQEELHSLATRQHLGEDFVQLLVGMHYTSFSEDVSSEDASSEP